MILDVVETSWQWYQKLNDILQHKCATPTLSTYVNPCILERDTGRYGHFVFLLSSSFFAETLVY